MDAETFVKICGLLNMPAPEVARESGYSLPAIKAARTGRRPISAALEKFMIDKLRKASGDAAVKMVLETCKMNGLNEKTLLALRAFEQEEDVKLSDDDTVYVWVYLSEDNTIFNVRVSNRNHAPEGVACEVRNLADIEDWWDDDSSYTFDNDAYKWVTVRSTKTE